MNTLQCYPILLNSGFNFSCVVNVPPKPLDKHTTQVTQLLKHPKTIGSEFYR